jgi:hypothetical protein
MMSFGAIAPAAMALDSTVWDADNTWWNLTNVVEDDELTYLSVSLVVIAMRQ